MVVVTKKNINRRNAISAIDPALTSGADLLAIIYFFTSLDAPAHKMDPIARIPMM